MNAARLLGRVLLAGAALAAMPAAPALAQPAAASHEVRKGESLYAIGGTLRYQGVTRFQIVIGI